MKYVVVLPSIHKGYTEDCLQTCNLDNILVVDNTKHNLGVAASWNVGVRHALRNNLDYLVILSAAMRFGPLGGQDFVEAMTKNESEVAVEPDEGIGWHFIALRTDLFRMVGFFDFNYYPAYFEETDFAYRIQLAYGWQTKRPLWPKCHIDAKVESIAHGMRLGGVNVHMGQQSARYAKKWGGAPGFETFTTPFNLPIQGPKPWRFFEGEDVINRWMR